MNVKSLMLLLALAVWGASCSDDEATGGGTSGMAGRSELQIVFSGTGDSQSYEKTKAIATAKENQIDDLKIYLFAAASESGPYYYMETWEDGTAYSSTDVDASGKPKTNFKKTEAGTGWKASLYPNELPGVPYIKLFCVANNGVAGVLASDGATPSKTTDGKFYEEDGATEMLSTLTAVTTAAVGDGTFTVTAGTTETDFLKSFTVTLGAGPDGVISTPLLMTGQGKTKISGNVSKVNIDLTRIMARFDIDNTTSKSNLTIKKVSLAQGRKTAPLWDAKLITAVDKGDLATSDLIAKQYKPVEFEKIAGANQGLTESSIYVYPTLATDESYLILEGTYKSPVNSSQVAVTYHVPIVRTPDGSDKSEYIDIKANNRYCLRITDVTLSNVFGTFDVVDWTSAGGITIRPDNDSPVFEADVAFGGDNKPKDLNAANPDAKTLDYEVTGDADGKGSFTLTMAATGAVRCEKETMSSTKAGETDWLSIAIDKTEERDGVWYTTFKFEYTNSIGQQPVAAHFINDAASYDPSLWTTINFYGPKAVPSFAVVDKGNSKGNVTNADDEKAPTATIYSAQGSYVTFDITSIEGVEAGPLAGYSAEKIATTGFVHTFKISVSDASLAVGGDMIFKNQGDPSKQTTLTITKADPSLKVSKTADDNNAGDYTNGTEIPFITTGKLKIDLDQMNTGSYKFKIESPRGVSVNSLDCPWLVISQVHEWTESEAYTEYELKAKNDPENTNDFKLVFTNGLTDKDVTAPGFTLTLNKAYSKPKFTAATTPASKSDFNDAPSIDDYAPTANMYLAKGSKIAINVKCLEGLSFLEETTSGLTITQKGDKGDYEIEVNDATQFSVGTPTTVIAQNTTIGAEDRKAKLVITWLSPAIKVDLTANAAVEKSESGSDIVYTVYCDDLPGKGFNFDVTAPKGATADFSAMKTWASKTGSDTIGDNAPETYTIKATGDTADTNDITVTIQNKITNGGDQKIIFKYNTTKTP